MKATLLARLRRTTSLVAGSDPYASYAANGFTPDLVFDPVNGVYAYGTAGAGAPTASSFADMATYTGASLSTVFDSDGTLKWAAHNLLQQSDNLQTSWTADDTTIASASELVENTATANHQVRNNTAPIVSGAKYTCEVIVSRGAGTRDVYLRHQATPVNFQGFSVDLDDGTIASVGTGVTATAESLGGGEWLLSMSFVANGTGQNFYVNMYNGSSLSYTGDGTSSLNIRAVRVYRSDLGGMQDNPDTGDSYVPTTSAAVYKDRRNSYIYNGSSWVNAGILVEPAATNLVTQSGDLSAWTTSGVTVDTNAGTGVSGSATMDRINVTAGGTEHHVRLSVSGASATTYTISADFKNDGERYAFICGYGTGSSWATGVFDLSTQTLTDSSSTGYTFVNGYAENLGNGVVRCHVVVTSTGAALVLAILGPAGDAVPSSYVSGSPNFSAVAGEDLLVENIQLETGSAPTSYIPTSGSTVTRAAQTLQLDSDVLPYDPTALSFAVRQRISYADLDASSQGQLFGSASVAATPNEWTVITLKTNAGTGAFELQTRYPGFGIRSRATGGSVYAPGIAVPISAACRLDTNDMQIATDGTSTATAATDGLAAINNQGFGIGQSVTSHVSRVLMWGVDIGAAGIEETSA